MEIYGRSEEIGTKRKWLKEEKKMYLKRLEMYGFKSFADKTVLEFMPGITTVIGPNGSGKSNISDCIRWILGEQSMKTLRGSKVEDIIFVGTQNRKSLGFAEASLVFDNQDGKLPIEYNEVIVTRKIYRSGESGYFINKTPCRLKDIQELFMDTGIGKDGYSIIGQGKIDEILSNKSEDRRHIFEEAAGIVKYRARKVESEKKLENTKLNLLRVNDIISELETNLNPLKSQSEKARKFLDLREELKKIEIGLFVHNIEDFKTKIKELEENMDIFETQKVKEEEKANNIQTEQETLKEAIDKLIEEIEKVQNSGFEVSQKKEQMNSEIGINQERISNNLTNCERYQTDIEELEKRNQELDEEKTQKLERKEDMLSNREKYENELKEKEEELAKYSETLSEKALEIEGKKKIVEENVDKRYGILNDKALEQANFENLNKQENHLKSQVDETISSLDGARGDKDDLAKEFYEIEKRKNDLEKSLEEIKQKKGESSEKIKEFDEKINQYQSEYRMKDTRCKFLIETEKEKEGYSKSVKTLMKAIENDNYLSKGVHGVVAGLISVEEKYQTAIEMTLGASLQNIVTETEDEAKKLVNYLKEKKIGRASFLPINSVKGHKLSNINASGIQGYLGIASDLVKADKKYEGIIFNLLGKTVIVENMDSAINLAKQNRYSFKIVTLGGDVINPSGMISGGSVAPKTTSILGRESEIKKLEAELQELEQKIKEVSQEKEDYQKSVTELLNSFEAKQKEFQEVEILYATEKQKQENLDLEILKLESKLAKLREDLENTQTQKQENLQKQEHFETEVNKIEKENNELNNVIEEFSKVNRDNQKYIDDLNDTITNLKISVSSFDEGESSADEMIARIHQELEKNTEAIQTKKDFMQKVDTENQELNAKIETLKNQITMLETEVGQSQEKVENLKQERILKNEKLKVLEQEEEEQSSKVEEIKTQISKLEVKKSKIELEQNQMINRMWEEYELTPNNVGEVEEIENPNEVQKQVNGLRSEIRDLGSVDIDSIERYKEAKERYDFLSEQRLDLEESMKKLKKVIQDMTDTMQKQFKEQFKMINQNFNSVFKELFNGGKAELVLENEENVLEGGIEIKVQPPGKSVQNLAAFSGGERAFTAIALLFAILKMNPSPFCALDEIEAALDDVNVARFAEYLKTLCDKTQFLVITHRKGTMEVANTVYGITMEEKGISKLLSMKLN